MRRAWPVVGVVAVAIAVVLAASCSAKGRERASAPRMPGSGDKAEIEARWQEIQQARLAAGLTAEPAALTMAVIGPLSVDDAAAVCEAAPPIGTCHDVCTLAGSICDNARAICRIADELPGDDWARDRCGSAKGSCREAQERCCGCQPSGGLP